MSKKVKAIVWGAVAILILSAAVVVLVMLQKDEPDAEDQLISSLNESLIPLVNEDTYDLESAYISNQENDYTIELVGEEIWRIRELMDYDNLEYLYLQTLSQCANINATEIIEENCSDLSKFGFNDPILTLKLKYVNGHEYNLTVGAYSSDGNVQYVTKDGGNTVYSLPGTALTNLYLSKYEYIDKTVIKDLDTNEDGEDVQVQLNRIAINHTGLESPIVIEQIPDEEWNSNSMLAYNLRMVQPGVSDISQGVFEEKILPALGMDATAIILDNPDEAALKEFGFDEPTSTFEVDYDDTYSIKITVGAKTRGPSYADDSGNVSETDCYYVMREGSKQIFVVPAEALTWLDITADELVSPAVILPYIADVETITVEFDGQKNVLAFTLGEDKTDMTALTAAFNGSAVEADYAKRYMQLLLYISAQGFSDPVEADSKPEMTITYRYRDGTDDVIRLYVSKDLVTTIELNGKSYFRGRSAYIDKVIKETAHLAANQQVDFDW
jgi:hypothetical protein